MKTHEKIVGNVMATLILLIIVFAIFSSFLSLIFRDDLDSIAGHGGRGNMYIDSAY